MWRIRRNYFANSLPWISRTSWEPVTRNFRTSRFIVVLLSTFPLRQHHPFAKRLFTLNREAKRSSTTSNRIESSRLALLSLSFVNSSTRSSYLFELLSAFSFVNFVFLIFSLRSIPTTRIRGSKMEKVEVSVRFFPLGRSFSYKNSY